MIISHRHQFIFFKTRKTAGTSIEMVLAEHCGPDDVITGINPASLPAGYTHPVQNNEGPLAYGHVTPTIIQSHVAAEVWNSYLKIVPIRNPWDRVVSMFWFRKQEPNWKGLDFNTFVRTFATGGPPNANHTNIPSHVDFLSASTTGPIAIDHTIRYEHLQRDIHALAVTLNLPLASLPHAKGNYRHDPRPFQEYFDSEHRDIVATNYANDIEQFNFTFEA
ncbi:MAG: sulfotransferase family 2 domain-containing protein [Arenicellales bacterium]|nr:sulfotransferase family 2 domain-containing protein [Arenicellales bacterium]